VCKFRSGRHVTVLTTNEQTARQCYGVLKGCDAVVMPSLESQDAVISAVIEDFKSQGKVSTGDPVVIVQGTNPVRGATSMMRIQYV
jgi:pyruvate kinase